MTLPAVPRYGAASLADVGPSVLAALGVGDEPNPLGLEPMQRVCLFLVDGLGWTGLQANLDAAPFLASMSGRSMTAGFPATTVSSLASLGTGLPSGAHGLTGYTSYVTEVGAVVNWLSWRSVGDGVDVRDRLVPEVIQPQPTVWERASQAGIATTMCTYEHFVDSGLTRSVLRGGTWGGTVAEGDAVARATQAMDRGYRALVYVYVSALDLVGHLRGPRDEAWCEQLAIVDRIAERIAAGLPAGSSLLVTADHGMVTVPDAAKVDFDSVASLQDGVIALAGEPRMRHVHAAPAAVSDVRDRWRETLGADWHVTTRDEAIAAGLFGPQVTAEARSRIGDVLALALGDGGVVERRKLPRLSAMPGQHGSLTDAELLVPLLTC